MHETITRAIVNEHVADRVRTADRERLARSVRRPHRRLRLVLRHPWGHRAPIAGAP